MGAGQSSDKNAGSSSTTVKTSYYELIGVHRTATEDEIKKAYRRKALELHPDRNYGNEDEATKIFAEVQAAYEILSDPQERAWYDSHESAILRGDDIGDDAGVPSYENVRITTADDLARLVRKFNSGVEFSDAPSGFFGFLRETFEQLAKEEEIAGDWDNVEVYEYPTFGHKDDQYEDVVKKFYATWQSFSTVKNFSWKDKYRLSEAPDRWVRRRMEQENKKLRQDGVREFNDAVRSLVAFIRKRDPRYVPSTQTEAERQKVLRDAAAAQAARARVANAAKLNEGEVSEWTKFREPEELEESEEEIIEQQIFECVACNKEFKSERQWEAHEKSKKHQKAVFALQKKMRKENAHLDLDDVATSNGTLTPEVDEDEYEYIHSDLSLPTNGHRDESEDGNSDGDGTEQDANGVTKDDKFDKIARSDDDDDDKNKSHDVAEDEKDTAGDDEQDEDYASIEAVQARLQGTSLLPTSAGPDDESDADDLDKPGPKKKLGKAAQKRAKRAAAATVAAEDSDSNNTHKCATCNAGFPSKTQLFQHIKDHNHAAPKSVANGGIKGKGGKGKR